MKMKRNKVFSIIMILFVLAFLFAGCGIVPTPTPTKGTISGKVMIPPDASKLSKDITGWVPAANATVTVVDAEGVSHSVTTDEDGYYVFENIAVNSNTVVTATVTVDGKTIVLKGVIPQEVAADEDYDAGTMTPESTALALVVEKMIAQGVSPQAISLAEIQGSEDFAALTDEVADVLETGGNVTESGRITNMAGNIANDILNPPAPPTPTPTEKKYHTYKFVLDDLASSYVVRPELTNPDDDDFRAMTPVKLSIAVKNQKDKAYQGNVRVAAVGETDLQLWAKDTNGTWHDINNVGWGPLSGFPINLAAENDIYIIATAAFEKDVTLQLVDITGDYKAAGDIMITQKVTAKSVVDDQDPSLESVTPAKDSQVDLQADENFVLTVDASDNYGLYELEIDHSMETTLPEFSVYADEDNPYGTEADKTQFETAGVTVTYDKIEQKWVIDFGANITNAFVANGGITFYLVIVDSVGNEWGSMSPPTDDNTFAYTIARVFNGDVAGVLTTDLGTGAVSGTLTGDFDLTIAGTVTGYTENRATFVGGVGGDITGTVTGGINAQGIDTLYGIITDTGAAQTVRIIGTFPQSGTSGDFEGTIITGPEKAPVTTMSVDGAGGYSTVVVGYTLQMIAEITPNDGSATDKVLWSVWTGEGDEYGSATIDKDTGLLTGVSEGKVSVIAKTLDDSNLTYAIKQITVDDGI